MAGLLNGLATIWLVTHPDTDWGMVQNVWLLTAYAIFCVCSLAGADLGRRTGQLGEAAKQTASPFLLLVALAVTACGGYLAILLFPLPLAVLGLQGFGAMALSTHLRSHSGGGADQPDLEQQSEL